MNLSIRQPMKVSGDSIISAKEALRPRILELSAASKDFLYKTPESFLSFLSDEKTISEIKDIVSEKTKNNLPKIVFVVGIGGANLASKAVYDAIVGHGEAIYDLPRKMVFLDVLDTAITEPVLLLLKSFESVDDFVIVVVSKSGETLEVMANAEFLTFHLEQKFENVKDRIVVVSKEGSPLWNEAEEKQITKIALPEVLSDRFSAFSPTTLVPLGLYGFLFDEFLSGAKESMENSLDMDSFAFQNAVAIDEHYANGMYIYDLFFFTPRLETLGKWHKQLVAESLGKDENIEGEKDHVGLAPTVSIGSVDLHSTLQLVLAGPRNRVTTFVSADDFQGEAIGDGETLDLIEKSVSKKSTGDLNQTLLVSAQESYFKNDLPYVDVVLKDVSLKSLGEYMAYAMFETIYLGALWNVNIFNQPNVEEYKKRAKEMLSGDDK